LPAEVVITGMGLATALGEGESAHWTALSERQAPDAWIDDKVFAPYTIHPIRNLDLSRTIPKKGDQRAMGPYMHYGVHAAGLALEDAKIAGNESLLSHTHLIVGGGGGERDTAADEKALLGLASANNPGAFLNETLQTELRPTLFLAQLPNLFAGNISIVHGVTGSSRTFMGEEMAGVDAVRIAFERISAGQGDLFLVGAAHSAQRLDLVTLYPLGGYLARGKQKSLWSRPKAGIQLGSVGAFLVLESKTHAAERGAQPIAKLSAVRADRTNRRPGEATAAALAQWNGIKTQLDGSPLGVLSGASGSGPITAEERAFLESLEHPFALRGTAAALGHGMEASFLANLALAAAAARRKRLFAPLDPDPAIEAPLDAGVRQFLVTQWGHHRGEAMALVESVS
jgi:3-oxoacyl-[acyl-carrier-protein] synthase II